MRYKAATEGGKQIRLVEFTKKFVEPDWCTKGHIGYILEGQLEINFNGNISIYNTDDALCIPEGENHKHKAKTISNIVNIFLVEEI